MQRQQHELRIEAITRLQRRLNPAFDGERKLDGVRCLAFRDRGDVRLMSRNRKPLTDTYPEVTAALERQRRSRFVVDGEIVIARDGTIKEWHERVDARSWPAQVVHTL